VANPLSGDKAAYGEVFNRIRGRVAELPTSSTARLGLLRAAGSILGEKEKITDLKLALWDQLAARLIWQDDDKRAADLVRSLIFIQLLEYSESLGDDDDPVADPLSLDPELVIPPTLSAFIKAARKDARTARENADAELVVHAQEESKAKCEK